MNESNEILYEKNGCSNLLVSFGGIKQNIGMPVFEFYKSLSNVSCDKCFIRDFNQAWYQLGVGENYNSIQSLKNYLSKIINDGNYKKVSFVGNSMGGFAAILFGVILNIDKIVVFSPQTFLGKWNRFINNDKRWNKQINRIHQNKNIKDDYFNLKKILNKEISFDGKISIYYSKNDRLDTIHARKLRKNSSVYLNEKNFGGHNLVRELKNSGELEKILAELFN